MSRIVQHLYITSIVLAMVLAFLAGFSSDHTLVGASPMAITSGQWAAVAGGYLLLDDASKANTTTSLQASSNTSAIGQSVTFTAITASSGGTPTGSVTFKDGASPLGTATLSGGTATFSTSSLGAGTHTITAVYGGDGDFTGSSSSPLTLTVTSYLYVPLIVR